MYLSLAVAIVLLLVFGALFAIFIHPLASLLAILVVAFIFLNVVMIGDTFKRQRQLAKMRKFRNSARTQKVPFTEQDRNTVV